MSTIVEVCEIHGARCGHLKCGCRHRSCSDCEHYRRFSGWVPLETILLCLKVYGVVESTAPAPSGPLPERP